MLRILHLTIVLVFSLISLDLNAQTSVILLAVKDNSMFSDAPGNSNALGADLLVGNTSGLAPRRGLIKFNLAASIPAGSLITSVTLTLNLNKIGPGATASNVSLFKLLADWGEGTSNAGNGTVADGNGTSATVNDATWPCRFSNGAGGCTQSWSTPGGDFVNTPSAITSVGTSLIDYSWTGTNLVADVQSWLNSSISNFGWIIKGDETIATTAKRYGSREHPTVANRPKLTVTYNSPAPVVLTGFRGSENRAGILLQWETSAEYNNAFFLIQHSPDGITFSNIGKVTGSGSTSLSHSYNFTHYGTIEGNHFYRLIQTDINGVEHVTPIVSIIAKIKHLQLSISPNPVLNILTIGFQGNTAGSNYAIYNTMGSPVQVGKLTGNQLLLSNLVPGFYMLRISLEGGGNSSGLFLKQ